MQDYGNAGGYEKAVHIGALHASAIVHVGDGEVDTDWRLDAVTNGGLGVTQVAERGTPVDGVSRVGRVRNDCRASWCQRCGATQNDRLRNVLLNDWGHRRGGHGGGGGVTRVSTGRANNDDC